MGIYKSMPKRYKLFLAGARIPVLSVCALIKALR